MKVCQRLAGLGEDGFGNKTGAWKEDDKADFGRAAFGSIIGGTVPGRCWDACRGGGIRGYNGL